MTKDTMDYKHIKTIKQPTSRSRALSEEPKAFVKTAFSIETETTFNELSDTEFQNVSSITGNSYSSGTFAQRARAAELQAARTLRESKIHPTGADFSSPIVPREPVTLKMPRRQKWTPLDLTAQADTEAAPVAGSSVGQFHQNKPQPQQNGATERTSERLVENTTTRNQDHYSLKSFNTLPGSSLQPHDLSEYPAELGARISNEISPRPHLPTFQPMDNQRFVFPQAQAANAQVSEKNNEASKQAQNPYFFDMNAPIRNSEQPGQANQFARPAAAPGPEILHYPNNNHYSTQQVGYASSAGINPVPVRNYPAVKGTPTAVGNNAGTLPGYPHNLHAFQAQNYNPMPSQGFEHVVSGSSQHGNHRVAQQPNTSVGGANFPTTSQSFQGGIPPYHNHELGRTLPQAASYGQPIQPAANIANSGNNTEDHFMPRGPQLHVGSRYLEFERELEACVATNPFNPREKLTRRQERDKMEKELDEWWTRDARFTPREKQQMEEVIANERRARMQNPDPFGPIGSKNSNTVPKPNTVGGNNNKNGDVKHQPKDQDPTAPYTNEELVNELLLPAMANLLSYKTDKTNLNPFGPPPSWAIDHTPGGNESFFSQQWGQPPQRVGRDPRYRAMQHDGRSSVFEDPTGRFPREEFTHDRGRGRGRGNANGNSSAGGSGPGGGRWGPPLN